MFLPLYLVFFPPYLMFLTPYLVLLPNNLEFFPPYLVFLPLYLVFLPIYLEFFPPYLLFLPIYSEFFPPYLLFLPIYSEIFPPYLVFPPSFFGILSSLFGIVSSLLDIPTSLFDTTYSLFEIPTSSFGIPPTLFSIPTSLFDNPNSFPSFLFARSLTPQNLISLYPYRFSIFIFPSCLPSRPLDLVCYPTLNSFNAIKFYRLFLHWHCSGAVRVGRIHFPPEWSDCFSLSIEMQTLFSVEMWISEEGTSGSTEGHDRERDGDGNIYSNL